MSTRATLHNAHPPAVGRHPGLLTHADSGPRSLDDRMVLARRRTRPLTIASNGVGTTPHSLMGLLMDSQGLRSTHLPSQATAQQMLAVAAVKEPGDPLAASSSYGPAGPAGVPAAVVQSLHDAFEAARFGPVEVAEERTVERLGLAKGG